MTILKRTASLAFASAVGALLGGCALVSPQQDQWQPAPVGASWVSEKRRTGSFGTRDVQVKATRGASTWKGTPVASVSIQRRGHAPVTLSRDDRSPRGIGTPAANLKV